MKRSRKINATLMAVLLTVSLFTVFVSIGGVAPAAADGVQRDEAEDLTDEANFTINLPAQTDHLPGDQNEANGSIEYFAQGEDAFEAVGAEDGVWIDYIVVDATSQGEDWIDYSECETANTAAFGIDRGNNNSGTQIDEDLVQKQRDSDFRDDGITIEFFDFDSFGDREPPYLAPEDAIVAAQGAGSNGGPCLTMTDEPGWYRIEAFMNGTVADNGPDEEPSDDADEIGFELNSNYVYVCDCENEAEAREQLGSPPDEEENGGGEPTPTEEPADDPTPTEEPADDPTPTEEPADDPTPTEEQATERPPAEAADDEEPLETPTVGDGPGFGAAAAVLALFVSGLLAYRRR